MAVVGTKVETMQEGDTKVAVKTDVMVDTNTGLLMERKTVFAEVPTEGGGTAVIAGQRTSLAAIEVKFPPHSFSKYCFTLLFLLCYAAQPCTTTTARLQNTRNTVEPLIKDTLNKGTSL